MSPEEYKTIVFISFVVVVLVVYFIRKELENKRKKQIEYYSKRNGIEYSELKLDFLPEITKEGSILLSKNGENNAIALMSGEKNGFKYYLFDFSNSTKSGRVNNVTVKTICIISKENIKFPHFYIRDESILFDHIIDSKAGEDINFTEDSEFSNKFILFGASEEKVRDFFDRGRRNTFVKKHVKGYIYEGFKNCFIVSNDKLLNINERLGFLDKCLDIFRGIVPDDNIIDDAHQKN